MPASLIHHWSASGYAGASQLSGHDQLPERVSSYGAFSDKRGPTCGLAGSKRRRWLELCANGLWH